MVEQVGIKRMRRRAVRALLLTPAVLLSLLLLWIFLLVASNWGDLQVSSKLMEENLRLGMSKEEILEFLPPDTVIFVFSAEDSYDSDFERITDVPPDRMSQSTGWVINYADAGSLFFRHDQYRLDFTNGQLSQVIIETTFGLDELYVNMFYKEPE